MLEGQLPTFAFRLAGRLYSCPSALEFHRCFLRLQPDQDAQVRSREDILHHQLRTVLLQSHVFRLEERWGYLPTTGE